METGYVYNVVASGETRRRPKDLKAYRPIYFEIESVLIDKEDRSCGRFARELNLLLFPGLLHILFNVSQQLGWLLHGLSEISKTQNGQTRVKITAKCPPRSCCEYDTKLQAVSAQLFGQKMISYGNKEYPQGLLIYGMLRPGLPNCCHVSVELLNKVPRVNLRRSSVRS